MLCVGLGPRDGNWNKSEVVAVGTGPGRSGPREKGRARRSIFKSQGLLQAPSGQTVWGPVSTDFSVWHVRFF